VAKRFLVHGKWPKILVNLHYYSIISFILLLITGLALWLPSVHTPLIPYLPLLYQVHILLGLIFAVTLLTPLLRLLPAGKQVWRLDWLIPIVFGIGIVITGVLLWGVTVFPVSLRSVSFKFHGDLSYVLAAWLLLHAYTRVLNVRPKRDGVAGRVDLSRRRFLRWSATGVLGSAFLILLDPFTFLSRLLAPAPSGSKTAAPGSAANSTSTTTDAYNVPEFGAYYTVTGRYVYLDTKTFTLRVDGLVSNPSTLHWTEIIKLPKTSEIKDFQCVTGWSVPQVTWEGVAIQELVQLVKPSANAKFVNFYSADGQYTESLSLKEALDSSVLLAYSINKQDLPIKQGYPLRLIVPKMYGYKSIKWLNRVEFSAKPLSGFWEQRGYPADAFIGNA